MRCILTCCLLWGLVFSEASGALDWKHNLVEVQAEPGAKTAEASFVYSNTGTAPLRITKVKNSCGCTSTDYSKEPIAPAETGELKAVFDIGSRRGMQKKTIEVTTSDGVMQRLGFYVNVTETISMDRKILMWKRGERPGTQSIEFQVNTPQPLNLARVESDEPGLRIELESVEAGRKYRLHVTPASTANAVSAKVRIFPEGLDPLMARVRIR